MTSISWGVYRSGTKALDAIRSLSPDLVFLDIQMPGMSGFELISKLQPEYLPAVVFATAYDSFAVDAFRVHAWIICSNLSTPIV